jgi:predicted type IV restriction endonuclease
MSISKIEDDYTKIEVLVRDPDDQLVKMIEHIRLLSSPGHSFIADVDPDASKEEGREYFSFDGDGVFYIKYVKKNGKKVTMKDGKILENYLRDIQC